ncbi:MAG: hypothetical protein CME26_02940 [Gemmatimonadetes bacterium]|nr:hypothetical protein [Gemmatimonadota bacterium]|tara:strand:+ start:5174 stop:5791 length:618 start_codon:yes stop_codon:yes gene_type:complete
MEILKKQSSTRENLGLLAVLEALEGQEQTTQRELAQATGLNLKKVNYTLQKLLEKGYVKFQRVRQNPDKRNYLYILTPAGIKAKSQLTYGFLKFTLDFYTRMEDKLLSCVKEIESSGVDRIALYGASDVARILLGIVADRAVKVVGVVDPGYAGREYHGCPIIPVEDLSTWSWDAMLITSIDDPDVGEAWLLGEGVSSDRIRKLS